MKNVHRLFQKFNHISWRSFKFSALLLSVMLMLPNIAQAEFHYNVKIKTGWKGTDADITILLIGTKGAIEDYWLLDNPDRNDFWPHTEDEFVIQDQKDIGIITDIWIKPRGIGLSVDHWKMEYILAKNMLYPDRVTKFEYTPIIKKAPNEKELKLRALQYQQPPVVVEGVDRITLPEGKVFSYVQFGAHQIQEHTETVSTEETENYSESSSNNLSVTNSWSVEAKTSFGDGIIIPEVEITATYAGEISTAFANATNRAQSRGRVETKTAKYTGEPCAATFYVMPKQKVIVYGTFDDGFGREIRYQKSTGSILLQDKLTKYVFRAVDDRANGDCTNCPSFQTMWVQSGRSLASMPNGPTLASRARLATTDVCYIPPAAGTATPPVVNTAPPVVTTPPASTTTNTTPPPASTATTTTTTTNNTSTTIPPVGNGYQRLQNCLYRDAYVHNQSGGAEAGEIQAGWWSAQWKIVPAHDGWVRIQNRWYPDQYLHYETVQIECGTIQPNWASALWKLIPVEDGWVRIQNGWYQDHYLHLENGIIEVGPIQSDWESANWRVE